METILQNSDRYIGIGQIDFPDEVIDAQRRFPDEAETLLRLMISRLKNVLQKSITITRNVNEKVAEKYVTSAAKKAFSDIAKFMSKCVIPSDIYNQDSVSIYYLMSFDRYIYSCMHCVCTETNK